MADDLFDDAYRLKEDVAQEMREADQETVQESAMVPAAGENALVDHEARGGFLSFLSDDMQVKYLQLFQLVDRRPVVKGMNRDFALFWDGKGGAHIEPTRDLCLKVVAVFKCNYEVVGEPHVIPSGNNLLIGRDVKVSFGDQHVTETGGSTTQECQRSGSRAFHDALARATTRAFKRGLEALIGLPFINMMIESLFGGFQVGIDPDAEVVQAHVIQGGELELTPEEAAKLPDRCRERMRAIYGKLQRAHKGYQITREEREARWRRAMMQRTTYLELIKEEKLVDELIASRQGEKR